MTNLQRWKFLTSVCASSVMMGTVAGCGSDSGTEATTDGGGDTAFDASGFDTSAVDTGKFEVPPGDAPSCSLADGGDPSSVCPAGKWRNFEGATCDNCPAATLLCETSFNPTGVTYDTAKKILDVQLRAGKTQLLSGRLNVTYTALSDCFATGPSGTAVVKSGEVPIVPLNDHFTADFSSLGDVVPCGIQTLNVTDGCCSSQTVRIMANRDSEGGRMVVSCPTLGGDGGTDGSGSD